MVDNGTGGDAIAGDGIFSATIPGGLSGSITAFYIQAVDNHPTVKGTNLFPQDVFPEAPLVRIFPSDAVTKECLIRFGELQPMGSFGTYHLWITASNNVRWTGRDKLNNSVLDGTFVYNNYRLVYNARPLYAGSP